MYIKKMFGFVIPETWNSRIHMYDKYGHISPFSFCAKKYIPKPEKDSSLSPELENDESYKELKKAFEKIGDSYLSSIQVDARIALLRQIEFKMDMSTVNNSLSVDLAKIAGNIPENDAIPEDIISQSEPVMQQCANRLADVIDRYNQEFRSYLSLKELENTGYDRYLYLSEKTNSTCSSCGFHHGQVYSMQDLERNHIIPPVHPNCKCSLIAIDRNAVGRYNADKQGFLDKIGQEIYNSIGGIYRFDPSTGLLPIPTVPQSNTIITNDSSDPKWYDKLRDWASNFGEDAKKAWDDFYADALKRSQNKFNNVPSFLDWLTFGIPSGIFDSFTERSDRMLQDPNVYNIANWLLMGIPDTINGAINPDEPFSFDHWMNSLETATLLYGGYQTAKGAIKQTSVPKFEDELNSGYQVAKIDTANDINKIFKETLGYEPPYKPETIVKEIKLLENKTYVRVYDGVNSKMQGGWVMDSDDIIGLTPTQIQNKYALLVTPKYICDVDINAGTFLRTGEANGLFEFEGGGIQYDLKGQYTGKFYNEREILGGN